MGTPSEEKASDPATTETSAQHPQNSHANSAASDPAVHESVRKDSATSDTAVNDAGEKDVEPDDVAIEDPGAGQPVGGDPAVESTAAPRAASRKSTLDDLALIAEAIKYAAMNLSVTEEPPINDASNTKDMSTSQTADAAQADIPDPPKDATRVLFFLRPIATRAKAIANDPKNETFRYIGKDNEALIGIDGSHVQPQVWGSILVTFGHCDLPATDIVISDTTCPTLQASFIALRNCQGVWQLYMAAGYSAPVQITLNNPDVFLHWAADGEATIEFDLIWHYTVWEFATIRILSDYDLFPGTDRAPRRRFEWWHKEEQYKAKTERYLKLRGQALLHKWCERYAASLVQQPVCEHNNQKHV